MKTTRFTIMVTEDIMDRLEQLKEKRMLFNISEGIRYCIAETYRREFPDYITARPKKMTPEEKGAAQLIVEETKTKIKEHTAYEKQKSICDQLGGVEGDGYCHYQTYSIMPGNELATHKVQEPFEVLTEKLLGYQYRDLYNQTGEGAKKEILELLKDK